MAKYKIEIPAQTIEVDGSYIADRNAKTIRNAITNRVPMDQEEQWSITSTVMKIACKVIPLPKQEFRRSEIIDIIAQKEMTFRKIDKDPSVYCHSWLHSCASLFQIDWETEIEPLLR